MIGIYCIRNKVNDKRYIGQSVNVEHRKSVHFNLLRTNNHFNSHLQSAYNHYGNESFEFLVLENVNDILFLTEREQYWFEHYKPNVYNQKPTVDSCAGVVLTDEHKNKISQALKGIKHSVERRANQSLGQMGKVSYVRTDKVKETISRVNSKQVVQIDKNTNKVIRDWFSADLVEKELGINSGNISLVCQGKRKTAGGYKWSYKEGVLSSS